MSVNLVVIRIETADKHPSLKHIEFLASSKTGIGFNLHSDSNPLEWPALVTDRLMSMHRGQRENSKIIVTTLNEQFINKEMATLKESSNVEAECHLEANERPNDSSLGGDGGILGSTAGPSGSKEGTPGSGDEGVTRRTGRSFKECLHFISGNPMVDVTQGILHLYKENTKTSLEEDSSRSEMLCMLAVPTSTTIHDLLQFTAPCFPAIQHLRIIRDSNPNQYMVLVKFRSQSDADLFYSTFNGQTYNSIEPDICRLVYVARVETTGESEEGSLPIPGHSELPTCAVCLERMDESVDGILTILCNHSFHGECLAKWGDTSCPVCRYCQTPEEMPDQRCLSCGASESLWICLICGHVGCGRYVGGHAYRHFMETNHLFSLQVGNNRVWDYVRDNYVHRLLQSEGDGKVVSYERRSPAADTKEELMLEGEEKLSALQLEYTHLLSSQLESQREYYENKIRETKNEALRDTEESRNLAQQKAEEAANVKEELVILKRDKQAFDKKLQHLYNKLNKVSNEFETEQQLNALLREGKKEWQKKVEDLNASLSKKEQQIKELESQVSDILTHFEAANAINANPELQGGQVVLGDAPKKPVMSRRKPRK